MKLCIYCRKRPEGPASIGVTPMGGVFVFRACLPCQRRVDDAMKEYLTLRKTSDDIGTFT